MVNFHRINLLWVDSLTFLSTCLLIFCGMIFYQLRGSSQRPRAVTKAISGIVFKIRWLLFHMKRNVCGKKGNAIRNLVSKSRIWWPEFTLLTSGHIQCLSFFLACVSCSGYLFILCPQLTPTVQWNETFFWWLHFQEDATGFTEWDVFAFYRAKGSRIVFDVNVFFSENVSRSDLYFGNDVPLWHLVKSASKNPNLRSIQFDEQSGFGKPFSPKE